MGQNNTKSNSEADNRNNIATKARDQLQQEFNEQREQLILALQSVISTALRPNGIFPAEIIDMILQHFDESGAQFEIASCCKLWLSVTLSKSYDWFLRRRFVRSNMVNGLFWPTILLNQCWEGNQFEIACDWSMRKNSLIMNNWVFSEHKAWEGGGIIAETKAHHMDLTTNKLRSNEDEFGTFYINNTKVVVKYMFNPNAKHALWQTVTCYKADGSSFEIKYEGHGNGNRYITGTANMDGSNQLMLWDRSYFSHNTEVAHKIETFDLETGQRLHSITHTCFYILGFWKHYVISYNNGILSIVDLKTLVHLVNWNIKLTAPIQITLNNLLFIRNNVLAVGEDNFVRIHDLSKEKCPMITKIDVTASAGIKLKKKELAKVVSVTFDDWKLVTVTHVYRWYDGNHYNSMVVSDVLISIFDIAANYRHLNTIRTASSGAHTWPVEILLPENGKILINFKFLDLMEIDFLHPNIMKNKIQLLCCRKSDSVAKIQVISPVNMTDYLATELNGLDSITSTTYFLRDADVPITRNVVINRDSSVTQNESCIDDIFELDRSWQKRITFVYPVNKDTLTQLKSSKVTWMNKEEFDRHWEIRPEYSSTLHLTTLDLSKCHRENYQRFRPEHMMGDVFFLLFEEFDARTNQWLITDPFVPHGTNLELSYEQ